MSRSDNRVKVVEVHSGFRVPIEFFIQFNADRYLLRCSPCGSGSFSQLDRAALSSSRKPARSSMEMRCKSRRSFRVATSGRPSPEVSLEVGSTSLPHLTVRVLECEQPCSPALAGDLRPLRGDGLGRFASEIPHHLPPDRRVGIEQPLHHIHRPPACRSGQPKGPATSARRPQWTTVAALAIRVESGWSG